MTTITCMGSFFTSFFIYVVLSKLLFFAAVKYSDGEVGHLIFVTVMIDLIFLMIFPILILMVKGVC